MVSTKERLNEMLEKLHISQKEIAEKTGIHKSNISSYVNGIREPKHDKIFMIAMAFNVNPMWLMGFDVPMKDNGIVVEIKKESNSDHILKYSMLKEEYRAMIDAQIDMLTKIQETE